MAQDKESPIFPSFEPFEHPSPIIGQLLASWLVGAHELVDLRVEHYEFRTAGTVKRSAAIQYDMRNAVRAAEAELHRARERLEALPVVVDERRKYQRAFHLEATCANGKQLRILSSIQTSWALWSALDALARRVCGQPLHNEVRTDLRRFIAAVPDEPWEWNGPDDSWAVLAESLSPSLSTEVVEQARLLRVAEPTRTVDHERRLMELIERMVEGQSRIQTSRATQWCSLLRNPIFKNLLFTLAETLPLIALVDREQADGRVHFSIVEPLSVKTRGLAKVGLSPARVEIFLPMSSKAAAFRCQLSVPTDIEIVGAAWHKEWQQLEVDSPPPTGNPLEGYVLEASSVWPARLRLSFAILVNRRAVSIPGGMAALLGTLLLFSVSVAWLPGEEATGASPESALTVLLLVPAFLSSIVAQKDEHLLVYRLLVGQRAICVLSAVTVLIAATLLALPIRPTDSWVTVWQWLASVELVWTIILLSGAINRQPSKSGGHKILLGSLLPLLLLIALSGNPVVALVLLWILLAWLLAARRSVPTNAHAERQRGIIEVRDE